MEADFESGKDSGNLMGESNELEERTGRNNSAGGFRRGRPEAKQRQTLLLHILPGADRLSLEQLLLPVCVQKYCQHFENEQQATAI